MKLQKDVTHFNRFIALFLSLYLFSRSTGDYQEEEGEEVALREWKGRSYGTGVATEEA